VGVYNIIFRKKQARGPTVFISLLKFPAIYVNIKLIYRNKKLLKTSFSQYRHKIDITLE